MPRFTILTHDLPFLHWDFLLEQGDACLTWRLLSEPDESNVILAERLSDHRLLYLDYEGPVSGQRGTVTQWDSGTYQQLVEEPDKSLSVRLAGKRLSGKIRLTPVSDSAWQWTCEQTGQS